MQMRSKSICGLLWYNYRSKWGKFCCILHRNFWQLETFKIPVFKIRFCQNSTWVELSSWSLRQRGYHHRIPDATSLRALSGVHTPHRRDTRKWSDDYWARTRTRWPCQSLTCLFIYLFILVAGLAYNMAGVVGAYTGVFAGIGVLSFSYIALRALYAFWRSLKSYFLSPLVGLAIDVKSLGQWAGMFGCVVSMCLSVRYLPVLWGQEVKNEVIEPGHW